MFFALWMLACGGNHTHDVDEIDGLLTDNGEGWATEAPDAPFDIGPVTSALFIEDPDNGRSTYSSALLVLSDAELSCDPLRDLQNSWFLENIIREGNGLVFSVSKWSQGPVTLEGLYLSGYGYGGYGYGYGTEAGLYGGAFSDGTFWSLGYGGGAMWLNLELIQGDIVRGEYYATFWAGEFEAVHCGTWEESGGTGYWYY